MLTLPQRAAIRSDVRPTGPAPITTTTTRDIRRRTRSNVVLLTRKQQVTATVSATVNSIVAFGTSGSLPQRGVVVIARVTREDARLATSRREQEIGIFKRNLYHSHAHLLCGHFRRHSAVDFAPTTRFIDTTRSAPFCAGHFIVIFV